MCVSPDSLLHEDFTSLLDLHGPVTNIDVEVGDEKEVLCQTEVREVCRSDLQGNFN